jgi:hypothetical protein
MLGSAHLFMRISSSNSWRIFEELTQFLKKKKDFSVVILALVFRLLKVKEPLFLKEPILIINKNCSTLEKKHCMVSLVCTMICIIILELTFIVHTSQKVS